MYECTVALSFITFVCFVLILCFKTLSDLFVEDSRGVVVPFDAFSPWNLFVYVSSLTMPGSDIELCVCVCVCVVV